MAPAALRPTAGWVRALLAMSLLAGFAAPAGRAAAADRELVVFAASSLKEVFQALAVQFERDNPGVKVRLNLAGSQELRTQLEQGAAADVFASADLGAARVAGQAGAGGQAPRVFARNEPVIVVAAGNPAGVRRLADLARVSRLVVGAPQVPIGRYAGEILQRARVREPEVVRQIERRVVSRELNVRQVLAKVVLGEADAGHRVPHRCSQRGRQGGGGGDSSRAERERRLPHRRGGAGPAAGAGPGLGDSGAVAGRPAAAGPGRFPGTGAR